MLDEHGQPRNLYFNAAHRHDRAVHELLGMIRGVLVDGVVTPTEVTALNEFLRRNPDLEGSFPGDVLCRRIHSMVHAGGPDTHELIELRCLLEDTIGEHAGVHDFGEQASTTLPLTVPPPTLRFEGVCYVVTGAFMYGDRRTVTSAICQRGGLCEDSVTRRTNILLVGTLASRDWKHSSFGRKIEKAVQLRETGCNVAIVAEDYWVSQLRA